MSMSDFQATCRFFGVKFEDKGLQPYVGGSDPASRSRAYVSHFECVTDGDELLEAYSHTPEAGAGVETRFNNDGAMLRHIVRELLNRNAAVPV